MKMVILDCGHWVKWSEWGKGMAPTVGAWAWCEKCAKVHLGDGGQFVAEVDPALYEGTDGMMLLTVDAQGAVGWTMDLDGFDTPEFLAECLMEAPSDQWAQFGLTLFATQEALDVAVAEMHRRVEAELEAEADRAWAQQHEPDEWEMEEDPEEAEYQARTRWTPVSEAGR